jgi:hypothetical protein
VISHDFRALLFRVFGPKSMPTSWKGSHFVGVEKLIPKRVAVTRNCWRFSGDRKAEEFHLPAVRLEGLTECEFSIWKEGVVSSLDVGHNAVCVNPLRAAQIQLLR